MPGRELAHRVRHTLRPRTRYRELAEQTRETLVGERYARWRQEPLRSRTVLYESFSGNGMLDNPEAIFRALLDAPDMQDLEHVWALDSLERHPDVLAEFEDHPRVRFVQMRSPGYLEALATSGYLVNNATFPADFSKRPGQVYLNTWHGVPLKRMGYDTREGGAGSRNILRNFVCADYLLSACGLMTDTMYRSAFRLQGIFEGSVIEEGQPRVDRQLAAEANPDEVLADLAGRRLDVGGRKVVLYAPTWKGDSFDKAVVNGGQLVDTVRRMQAMVDEAAPGEYVVLLKVHQVIYEAITRSAKGSKRIAKVLVPHDVPTNTLLAVTDVLVTDYSSIFFDFLASGRPILHHVPDLDAYLADRGLYLAEDELPGPVSRDVDELRAHLQAVTTGEPDPAWAERYQRAVQAFAPHDDGKVCQRVIDVVFRGADPKDYRVRRDFRTDKPKLLIYVGALTSNGLTTSALNLLKNLDYDRFDVSVLYHASKQRDRARNSALVDKRARVFARNAMYIAPKRHVNTEVEIMRNGLKGRFPSWHGQFWRTEWERCFGQAQFDYALDLSGYGTFAPYLFIAGGADVKRRALWLHSDLMAESQRETVGEKHLYRRLNGVFATFKHFDSLVSVSEELNRVNSQKLAQFADAKAFTFASNTIDRDRVLRMAGFSDDGRPVTREEPAGELVTIDTGNLASAVSTLLQHFDAKALLTEVRSHTKVGRLPRRGDGVVTFVSVGRLSPEKNHGRLIRAFARVHEHNPDTRLVILGGGKLEEELRALVEQLGLRDYVTLAGQVENPYVVMAECDCFVMSSDYEGQPMVVLEARTLGLPVVTTAFASVEGSVPPEAGITVEHTDEALAAGMQKFLDGQVPSSPLDYEAYNRNAMRQFYAAIGAPYDG